MFLEIPFIIIKNNYMSYISFIFMSHRDKADNESRKEEGLESLQICNKDNLRVGVTD